MGQKGQFAQAFINGISAKTDKTTTVRVEIRCFKTPYKNDYDAGLKQKTDTAIIKKRLAQRKPLF